MRSPLLHLNRMYRLRALERVWTDFIVLLFIAEIGKSMYDKLNHILIGTWYIIVSFMFYILALLA